MQGKGKKLIGVPETEVAHYGSQGIHKKSIIPTKSITLHYLHSKAVLSLDIPDDKLVRTIVDCFRKGEPELTNVSILQRLCLPNSQRIDDATYYHRIDTKEALSLLFHLKQIRKGKIAQLDQQLSYLASIVQELQIKESELDRETIEQFDQRRRTFNNEVYHCRKAIKTAIQDRTTSIKNQFADSLDHTKLLILQAKIKQIGLEIFSSVVLGLREVSETHVEIIYEQCYPSRRCPISLLKDKIGEELYTKKKVALVKLFELTQRQGLNNTNLIVCHMCKSLLKEEYIRCSQFDMPVIDVSHRNSPNIHYKRLIAFDYCYDSFDPPSLDHELDYFKYSEYPVQRRHCSRFFCRQCLPFVSRREGHQDILSHKCQFCKQICVCSSCRMAQELVVSLAMVRDILERNYQSAERFRRLVDYVNFSDCDSQIEPYLRIGFRNVGKQEYVHSYHRCMDRYEEIYRGIQKYRSLAITDLSEVQCPSIILTHEMQQICDFMDEIHQLDHKQTAHSAHTSDPPVRQILQTGNPQTSPSRRQKKSANSLRSRYEAKPDLHNILRKYCIGKDEPIELPNQDVLQQDLEAVQFELMAELEPVSEAIAQKMAVPANEVPFDEEDYQRLQVSEQYKLMTERQIQFEMLVEAGIFHEVTDPAYAPLKSELRTFFTDVNDFFKTTPSPHPDAPNHPHNLQTVSQHRASPPEQIIPPISETIHRGSILNSDMQPLVKKQEQGSRRHECIVIQEEISSESEIMECKQEEKREEGAINLEERVQEDDEIQEIGWQQFMNFKLG